MFEYLVVMEEADGTERKEVVGFEELLAHIENALNEDDYCFWAYEIHQIVLDFSVPREPEEAERVSFKLEACPDCGRPIKENWIIRHRKSGCRLG